MNQHQRRIISHLEDNIDNDNNNKQQQEIRASCYLDTIISVERNVSKGDSSCLRGMFKGAGVILYSVDERNVPYIVMARDCSSKSHHMSHVASSSWSSFEGCRKGKESEIQTASREFVEESLGVVNEMESQEAVERMLLNRDYERRIVTNITMNDERTFSYVSFVKRIQHRRNLPVAFQNIRRHLRYLHTLSRMNQTTSMKEQMKKSHQSIQEVADHAGRMQLTVLPEYMEKDCISYFSVQSLHDAMCHRRGRINETQYIRPYMVPTLYVASTEILRMTSVSANSGRMHRELSHPYHQQAKDNAWSGIRNHHHHTHAKGATIMSMTRTVIVDTTSKRLLRFMPHVLANSHLRVRSGEPRRTSSFQRMRHHHTLQTLSDEILKNVQASLAS